MSEHQITIFDNASDNWQDRPLATFAAPSDKYAARALFVFLAQNLRPGLIVELDNGISQLTWPTDREMTPAVYAAFMGDGRLQEEPNE